MNQGRNLILLTQKYPFESGEEFLATELKFLEQAFDRVIILPTAVRDYSQRRMTGDNTQVRIVKNPATVKDIVGSLLGNFFQTAGILRSELKKSGWNWKLLKYYTYHIPYALQIKSTIAKELDTSGDFVLYSYWMDTNAFAAALLGKENPEINLVVRSHGGDLYNERQQAGTVAFRQTVYGESKSLIFISEHGKKYASAHYPEYSPKMKLFRLGVEDNGMGPTSDFPGIFQLVSCSSLISLKRVGLIAEVLNSCKVPVCWTHFGGEDSSISGLKNTLPALRDNLEILWKGRVKNEDLQSFYTAQHVDLFINLSSTEGIPVSIMEAISFGIPVFANSVGGIPEIVTNETGLLIPDGLSVEEIATQLDQFLLSGISRNRSFREGVRGFWSQNYSSEHNHGQVAKHLENYTFSMAKYTE
ncbi:glycosyltransferase involved in cell wall biosynthesis [Algoriphagus sp. 4150]|uniref:glycosyltransferase n=1 Tax=Algoriphagus sp. 4150 TaxID=2817756 RepID=UPI002855AA69|nr:glycosyltransferase [Algoriphagus sp. 4150]MDR7130532.1 glycosyltransferase involved in cell wall biosynthesis [Algoriphagus sp. 4150]